MSRIFDFFAILCSVVLFINISSKYHLNYVYRLKNLISKIFTYEPTEKEIEEKTK